MGFHRWGPNSAAPLHTVAAEVGSPVPVLGNSGPPMMAPPATLAWVAAIALARARLKRASVRLVPVSATVGDGPPSSA